MIPTRRRAGDRVLLAEDEFIIASEIEDLLEQAELRVVGPAAALSQALLLAQSDGIAAAILDVNLAGEQCWPVARLLRERGVPFFFLSGYLENHMRLPDDLADAPMLGKPIEAEQFWAALDETLPLLRGPRAV